MIRLVTALLLLFMLPASTEAAARAPVRVRLETGAGPIVIELEMKRAPITATNFLRYAEEKRFDGTFFYRAARRRNNPKTGLVQGGINHRVVRARLPIAHEPTSRTGLRHIEGTVSMARNAPGTAMGDFFITLGPAPYLDARPGSVGYAAFGKVVEGMPLIRKMLAAPTYPGGRSANTKGQTMIKPVPIISARRTS
jgi:peptidyl-prolyl cis-trans isomerase A (cyclophilin A)